MEPVVLGKFHPLSTLCENPDVIEYKLLVLVFFELLAYVHSIHSLPYVKNKIS